MKLNEAGLQLIKDFEGLRLKAYPDPGTGGVPWTIGYGHTNKVRPSDTCTLEQADKWLIEDVASTERAVQNYLQMPLTDNQFSALVCFAYNVGAWRSSTLFRLVKEQRFEEAAEQFPRWVRAGGKVLAGLVRRREAERELFLKP